MYLCISLLSHSSHYKKPEPRQTTLRFKPYSASKSKPITDSLVDFIATNLQPFTIVIKLLINKLNPYYILSYKQTLKEKFKVEENHEYYDEPILESSETIFDEIEEIEEEDNNNNNINKNKSKKKKINLNKPQDMYGLANQIKYNLHKFLNFYWPNPSVNELIACVLDPRVKALNFITSQKREEVFDILRQIYLEMCPEQLSMINTNQSTIDFRINSKKTFLLFTLVIICPFYLLAQARFTATISPATIGKNETFELRLMVENARGVEQINPPSLKDFSLISGPNSESGMESTNGVVKQYTGISYILQPKSTGRFIIGAATGSGRRLNAVYKCLGECIERGAGCSDHMSMPAGRPDARTPCLEAP